MWAPRLAVLSTAEADKLERPERFYVDFRSGSDAAKRPDFQRMVADARAGEFDVLTVYDNSRFARDMRDAVGYEGQLADVGVVVAFVPSSS